jgi:hypothetical protein
VLSQIAGNKFRYKRRGTISPTITFRFISVPKLGEIIFYFVASTRAKTELERVEGANTTAPHFT